MARAWLRALLVDLADESFRPAVLAGLVSVPFTVALSGELVFDEVHIAGGPVSGVPLLLVGLAVGYRYGTADSDRGGVRRAGFVAGIAGSVAVVVLYGLTLLTTVAEPIQVAALAALATPFAVVGGALLCGLVGMVGALVGDWVATQGSQLLGAEHAN